MVITALRQQIRDPERVNIFIDGKYEFSLTLSQIVAEKIKVGHNLSEGDLAELRQKSTNEKLRLRAINWVLIRPRSQKELLDYLRGLQYKSKTNKKSQLSNGGISDITIQAIANECIHRKLVDDTQFARWWVDRSSRQQKSNRYLQTELLQKGIDRAIITDALSSRSENVQLAAYVKKLKTKSKYQDAQKLTRFLVSKGYDYSLVKEALKLGEDESFG